MTRHRRYFPRLDELESRTVPSPVPFVIQNNSGIPDDGVYFSLYGTDPNFVSPTTNPNGFVYVDATGASHSLAGANMPYLAETTLAQAIVDDIQAHITVTSNAGFPTSYPPGAPTTPIIIDNEVMLVTGIVPNTKGLTWTVARGQFNTQKGPHSQGAAVKWDVQHVPDFKLTALPKQGNNYTLNLTTSTTLNSGRLLMGMQSKVLATIVTDHAGGIAGGKVTGVAPPNAGSATDPNVDTYYDFFELTLSGGTINGNTSQVDQFGIPYTLSFSPGDPNNPNGVGITATRNDVITAFKAFVAGTDFENCWKLSDTGNDGIFRILSPASILDMHPLNPLHTHFTAYVDQFYHMYSLANAHVDLIVDGIAGIPTRTYRGSVKLDGGNYVFQFTQHGEDPDHHVDPKVYNVYYPFFTTNAASYSGYSPLLSVAAPPSWLANTTTSPSSMVFGAHAVFADNTNQFPASKPVGQKVLGNIENQLVAALNRGVALSPTPGTTWSDPNAFYTTAPYNRYAHFFHQSTVSIDKKAYGFPYDDQANESSDFSVTGLTQLSVTFGPWGTTTKKQLFAVGGSNGQVQIYESDTNALWSQFAPYGAAYTGGVAIAWGDVNDDGFNDLITGAAHGNPHVNVYDGRDIENEDFDPVNPHASLLASWLAFDDGLNVGVSVAVGDVDKDGYGDIAAASNAGNAHVRLYKGLDIAHGSFNPNGASLQAEWFAYGLHFNVGANVAIGDVSGDGWADVITGASAGNPHVKVYSGEAFADGAFDPAHPDATLVWEKFTYELQVDIGVYVAVGDTNADGKLDVITGASTGNPAVHCYNGAHGALLSAFFTFNLNQNVGVTVGSGHVGVQPAILAASTHGAALYRAIDPLTGAEFFQGVPTGFPSGGVHIAA